MTGRKVIFAGIVLFIALAALGYFREYVFTTINMRLHDLYHGREKYPLPQMLDFLTTLSYQQLYYFKWVLTVFTSMVYLAIYIMGIKWIFEEKKYLKLTLFAFLVVYAISAIFYLYGVLFNDLHRGYHFSRIFMGFIQSPLLLMLLVPAFLLDQRNLQNNAG